MIPIIGFASPCPGCGKSTAVKLLDKMRVNGKELVVCNVPFAGPLKAMVEVLLADFCLAGAEIEYHSSSEGKEEIIPEVGASYRRLCQTLGTEWGRNHFPGIWLRAFKSTVTSLNRTHYVDLITVDDVRFPDEVDLVRELGGTIFYVTRTEAEMVYVGTDVLRHSSEQGVKFSDCSQIIRNEGSVEELRAKLHNAAVNYLGAKIHA